MPGPLNYTTTVDATRTVTECQSILAEHDVEQVTTQWSRRDPVGLSFVLDGRTYVLPVEAERMQKVLQAAVSSRSWTAKSRPKASYTTIEHARNVAWRVVKDWLEANLALVAAQQVPLHDVMLPYLVLADGRAVRDAVRGNLAALEASR